MAGSAASPASPAARAASATGSSLQRRAAVLLCGALLLLFVDQGREGGGGPSGAGKGIRAASLAGTVSREGAGAAGASRRLPSPTDGNPYQCFLGDPQRLVPSPPIPPEAVDCDGYGLKRRAKPAFFVDSFLISNENAAIVARILETSSVVDQWVLVESAVTFTEQDRNLTFPDILPCLLPFQSRITHRIAARGSFSGKKQAWQRETFLRNHLGLAAAEAIAQLRKEESAVSVSRRPVPVPPDDDGILFAVSDADELPRPLSYAVAKYCVGWREPAGLHLSFFYYNFKWKKPANWGNGPRIFPWTMITAGKYQPQDARDGVMESPEPVLAEGGWHLGYFLSAEGIRQKLRGFAHTEFDRPPFNTVEWIEESIEQGRDLFNRGGNEHMDPFECRSPDADIPLAVKGNRILLDIFCPEW